jgi:hypothetical protein
MVYKILIFFLFSLYINGIFYCWVIWPKAGGKLLGRKYHDMPMEHMRIQWESCGRALLRILVTASAVGMYLKLISYYGATAMNIYVLGVANADGFHFINSGCVERPLPLYFRLLCLLLLLRRKAYDVLPFLFPPVRPLFTGLQPLLFLARHFLDSQHP